jgi:hypothetical protein
VKEESISVACASKSWSKICLRNAVLVTAQAIMIRKKSTQNVHSFPTDPEERQRWLDILPNIVPKINKDTVVCVNHWPCDYETFKKR